MCTYNGGAFLSDQIQSIFEQTVLPDELIVCDDRSSDRTLSLIESLKSFSPFPIHLFQNQLQLGTIKNFEKAVKLCRNDVIFLCDQDDVWHPDRLEKMLRAFKNDTLIDALFCNAEMVDDHLRPLGYTMWHRIDFTPSKQRQMTSGHPLDVLLKHDVVTGATLAFRSKWKEVLMPVPDGWVHDAWFAIWIACFGRIVPIPEALVRYRQHASNQIGGKRVGVARRLLNAVRTDRQNYYGREIFRFRELLERLLGDEATRPEVLRAVSGKILHLIRRYQFPTNRIKRIAPMIESMLASEYHRYSHGRRMGIIDFLIP
jgi:glycosyltransferase involved in cell wall biosynthesis